MTKIRESGHKHFKTRRRHKLNAGGFGRVGAVLLLLLSVSRESSTKVAEAKHAWVVEWMAKLGDWMANSAYGTQAFLPLSACEKIFREGRPKDLGGHG